MCETQVIRWVLLLKVIGIDRPTWKSQETQVAVSIAVYQLEWEPL